MGSTLNVTRRTGEKMASTGMTPMVRVVGLPVGRQVAAAPLDGEVDGQAALGVERGDVEVGVEDLDLARHLDVAGGDVGRAADVEAHVTGSSESEVSTMSLRLRMMSVTSSVTPAMVSNSCRASSKRTW